MPSRTLAARPDGSVQARAGVTVAIRSAARRGGSHVHRMALARPICFNPGTFTMSWPADEARRCAPLIGHLKSGRFAYASDGRGRPDWTRPVLLAIDPGRPRLARSINADAEVAVIDLALLGLVAGATPGPAGPPVRFTGAEPLSAPAAQAWQATYAYVRDTVLTSPGTEIPALIVSSAARLLAAITLTTFPNTMMAGAGSDAGA